MQVSYSSADNKSPSESTYLWIGLAIFAYASTLESFCLSINSSSSMSFDVRGWEMPLQIPIPQDTSQEIPIFHQVNVRFVS